MKIFNLIYIRHIIALIFFTLIIPQSAMAKLSDNLSLQYKLEVRGHEAGIAHIEFVTLDDNRFNMNIEIIPSNMAALLGAKKSDEHMSIQITNTEWNLLHYTQQRRGKKKGITTVAPSTNGYNLLLDNKQTANTQAKLIESELYPAALVLFDTQKLTDKKVILINRDKFSDAQYIFQTNESITINDVTHQTSHWKRVYPNNPKVWMDIWVALDTSIPLRIQRTKSGKVTQLELIH